MKTIKLPYKTNEDLTSILKQYSSIVRYSYNRFLEGNTEKDIRELSKSLNNINLLNSWLKKNNKGFYPNLLVKHQWKEMATKFTDWKEFFI